MEGEKRKSKPLLASLLMTMAVIVPYLLLRSWGINHQAGVAISTVFLAMAGLVGIVFCSSFVVATAIALAVMIFVIVMTIGFSPNMIAGIIVFSAVALIGLLSLGLEISEFKESEKALATLCYMMEFSILYGGFFYVFPSIFS